MTLQNGGDLLDAGITFLQTPLDFWDGLSPFKIITAMIMLSIIGWFLARMIKGKGHSEISVQKEDASVGEYDIIMPEGNSHPFSTYDFDTGEIADQNIFSERD